MDRSVLQAVVYLDGRVTYGNELRLPLPRRVISRLGPAARARLAHLVSDPRLRLLAPEPRPCDAVVTCQGGTWLRVTLGETTWTVEHDHGREGPWSEFLGELEDEITGLLGVRTGAERRAELRALR